MAREMTTFSIRIDRRIRDRLDLLARRDSRKRNNLIEKLLAEAVGITPDELEDEGRDT